MQSRVIARNKRIDTNGKTELGNSVVSSWLDDDNDDVDHIYIYIYISKSKVGDLSRGRPEGSVFNSYNTEV